MWKKHYKHAVLCEECKKLFVHFTTFKNSSKRYCDRCVQKRSREYKKQRNKDNNNN